MMSSMAKNAKIQLMGRDIDEKLAGAQSSVAEVTNNVSKVDEKVRGVEQRIDNIEARRADTKMEMQQMKAEAIAEASM